MCNVCNSNGTSRGVNCGCQCTRTCCNGGWGNFWNTGFQFLCRDCNGNIRVGDNGCGCQYNRQWTRCGCQNACLYGGNRNGCGCHDTHNVFFFTGRAILAGTNGMYGTYGTDTANGETVNTGCDDYYARQYGLGRYGRTHCCCGTNNATFTTTTIDQD